MHIYLWTALRIRDLRIRALRVVVLKEGFEGGIFLFLDADYADDEGAQERRSVRE